MTQIRTRLQAAFLVIIVAIGGVGAVVMVNTRSVTVQRDGFDAALYLELGLKSEADQLVRTYNEYRNAPTAARDTAYTTARSRLQADADAILTAAAGGAPRPAVLGIHNTISSLIATTDRGVQAVMTHDLATADTSFSDAGRISVFVTDDVSSVILEELQASQDARTAAAQRSQLLLVLGTILLITATVGAVLYSLHISRGISVPLAALTRAAEQIASGSYGVRVDQALLRSGDETGSLARSFDSMSLNLQTTIRGLGEARETAERARKDAENKNELLEKLNKMFIIREARINELKAEVVRLGGRVTSDAPGVEPRADS